MKKETEKDRLINIQRQRQRQSHSHIIGIWEWVGVTMYDTMTIYYYHFFSPLVSITTKAGLLIENLIKPSVLAAQSSQGDEMNSWPLRICRSISKSENKRIWVICVCIIVQAITTVFYFYFWWVEGRHSYFNTIVISDNTGNVHKAITLLMISR